MAFKGDIPCLTDSLSSPIVAVAQVRRQHSHIYQQRATRCHHQHSSACNGLEHSKVVKALPWTTTEEKAPFPEDIVVLTVRPDRWWVALTTLLPSTAPIHLTSVSQMPCRRLLADQEKPPQLQLLVCKSYLPGDAERFHKMFLVGIRADVCEEEMLYLVPKMKITLAFLHARGIDQIATLAV